MAIISTLYSNHKYFFISTSYQWFLDVGKTSVWKERRAFTLMFTYYLVYHEIAFTLSSLYLYRLKEACIIKICTTIILRYECYFQIINNDNLWSIIIFLHFEMKYILLITDYRERYQNRDQNYNPKN